MSMDELVEKLSEEQKAALIKILSGDNSQTKPETNTEPPSKSGDDADTISFSYEVTEDFRVVKNDNNLKGNSRRVPVNAGKNTWTDTGEHKEIVTPNAQRTPRNRPPPKKKEVLCNACGKTFKVNANMVYGEFYRCDRCGTKR